MVARQERLTNLIRSVLVPMLEPAGFVHRELHFVRNEGEVIEVVEVQPSIYGSRFTVNFGLDLEFLEPLAPWIPRPKLGPHAQDCLRWIRLGELLPGQEDRWWSFESEHARQASGNEIASLVAKYGLKWLTRHRKKDAFFRHAEARLARSRSPRRPFGRFEELRLYCAIAAWTERDAEVANVVEACRRTWPAEREHLEEARRLFLAATGRRRAPKVPDGLSALLTYVESTRTALPSEASSARVRRTPRPSSRSERSRSPRSR